MHIEIDDQYLFTAPLVEAGLRGNYQIVEQTKTAAMIPMGVVVAAGDLQAAALLKRIAAGGNGGTDRAQGALHQHG